MRAGDGFLLCLIGLTVLLGLADAALGGAIGAWLTDFDNASRLGRLSVYLFFAVMPLLILAPPVLALWGRFFGLPDVLASALKALIGVFDAVVNSVGGAARWLALGLVAVTATIVIQRYVFGYASTKLQESVIYMHALLFLLGSGATLLADGHVRVDIFYAKASERGKAWIELAGTYLALLPMSLLILHTSTPYISGAWRVLESSRESDGLPYVYLLKTAIPVFAVLMIIAGLSIAARAALTLSGREAPKTAEAVDAHHGGGA